MASILVRALAAPGIVAGFLCASLAGAPASSAQQIVFDYDVDTRGPVQADVDELRAYTADALSDPRGWTLGGTVAFRPVAGGGDLHVVLATPDAVDAAHPNCSAQYSCRVGDDVLINEERWTQGSVPYPRSLDEYRRYVINHEVGHWLGVAHRACPGAGAEGPVMMQQSKGLDACRATVWPLPAEQRAVAAAHSVALARQRVLQRGDVGAGVAEWQQHLAESAGQSLVIDGIFGPSTEAATIDFQSFFGLAVDGVVGPETRGVMDYIRGLSPRTMTIGARGLDVAQWQRDLNQLSGTGLAVDGIFGLETFAATTDWERFFGLPADGTVGDTERDVVAYLSAIQG